MRLRLGPIAAAAVLVLSGCVTPPGGADPASAPTLAPGPGATSEAPAGDPAPSETDSAAPEAPASQTVETAPYCGDESVLVSLRDSPTGWVGDDAEMLERAWAVGGFEPASALEGLAVHCTSNHQTPTDGDPGVVTVNFAVLLPGADVLEHLEQWSTANGYEPAPGTESQRFMERYAPPTPDGTTTTKIFWAPLDGDEPTIGQADEIRAATSAPEGAILVWFSDFTQENR